MSFSTWKLPCHLTFLALGTNSSLLPFSTTGLGWPSLGSLDVWVPHGLRLWEIVTLVTI